MTANEYIVLKYIALCGVVRKNDITKRLSFLPVHQMLILLAEQELIDESLENVVSFNAFNFPYVYSLTPAGLHALHEFEKTIIVCFFKALATLITILLTAVSLLR